MISSNNPTQNSSAINSLQTNLVVSNATANALLSKIHQNSTLEVARINSLLVENIPKVISYFLYLIESDHIIRRPESVVVVADTIYYLPAAARLNTAGKAEPQYEVEFSADFLAFYEKVLVLIIAKKLEALVIGIQDLKYQLGVTNISETYNIVRTMDEAGVAQLTDYAYATKADLIQAVVDDVKDVNIKMNSNLRHIPERIHQVLLNPMGEIVKQFQAANYALKNIMRVEQRARIQILNSIAAAEVINIPKLAGILRRAAIMFRQSDHFAESVRSLKHVLLYGSPIQDYDQELYWARARVSEVYADKFVRAAGVAASELLITNKFIQTVLDLPKIPCDDCPDYTNIAKQFINLNQVELGFDVLAAGKPLPVINFTAPQKFNALPAPTSSSSQFSPLACLVPDISSLGIGLGIVLIAGFSTYLCNRYCRAKSFWYSKKVKDEPNQDPVESQALLGTATHRATALARQQV